MRLVSVRGATADAAANILLNAPGTDSASPLATSRRPASATSFADIHTIAGKSRRVGIGAADTLELGAGQARAQRRDVHAGAAHFLVKALATAT